MDAGSLPGWATFGRARPAMATAPGTCLRCGSPVSCISTVISLLFSWAHRRREPKSAAPRTTPDCRREANVLETRRKSIGPSAHLRYREEKVSWLGGGRRCFFIVVYNAGCGGSRLQPQPKVERERGPAARRTSASIFEVVLPVLGFRQRSATTRPLPSRT